MAERSTDVKFLQEQVERLNNLLSQYQSKDEPPSSQDEQTVPPSLQSPHATWLTDKRLLSPLLTEYDNIITQLQHNITTYQSELMSLNSRVEQVTAENARLYQQLRESLESRLVNESREGEEWEGIKKNNTALQNQLTTVSKEREEYKKKWRQMTIELEHLQKTDREKNQSLSKYKTELATTQHKSMSVQQKMEELQTACVKLNEEYNMSMEAAHSRGQVVEELTQALSDTRCEYKALQIKNTQLLNANSELAQQLRLKESEKGVFGGQGQIIDGRVHLLELSNAELEAKLISAMSDVAVLTKEKVELEDSVTMHQTRLAGLEREVREAVAHVKESMEMVESAILDKDQAVIVSEQKTQETAQLRAAMDALVQEAGHRTRKEVDAIREEYNKNIDKMAVEIHELEQECGNKQTLIERYQREKKAAEKELERIRERLPVEAARVEENLNKLQDKVHQAERIEQEAHRKMNAAFLAQQAAEASLAEEKRHHEEVCNELERRLREGEEEKERIMIERTRLARQLQEMMEQLRVEKEERKAAERRTRQEVAAASQRHTMRERELQQRLQIREQAHNKSTEELRDLLSSQYHMGTRWRQESKNMTEKFEETITSLRNEVTSYRTKNEVLIIEMNSFVKQKEKQSQHMKRLQANQSQLQQQLKGSETRKETAVAQVSSLLLREKQLLVERRELQRKLDKLKLEIAHRASLVMSVPMAAGGHHPHLPTSTPLPPGVPSSGIDVHGWGQAVSSLRQSIREARQNLDETFTTHRKNTHKTEASSHNRYIENDSPDSSMISEHSMTSLHRTDITSHSNNTQQSA